MWAAIRILRLYSRSLVRIAIALEDIRDLYQLELNTRGIQRTNPSLRDPVEVEYSSRIFQEEDL